MNYTTKSAKGVEACLIYCGDGQYRIRIYDKDFKFKDYDICHSDLSIKIDDEDAYLYEYEDNKMFIDHSPETLGINSKGNLNV